MNQQSPKHKSENKRPDWIPDSSVDTRQEQNQDEQRRKGSNPQDSISEPAQKMRTLFGLISLVVIILSLVLTSSLTQEEFNNEIANRTSTSIESGTTLIETTDIDLEARDFDIGEFDGGTARMLIWDFTGDSEDKVQIIVDGQIMRKSHTLTSSVAAYSVPVPSVVTIQGLDSNATYAVKFPERRFTIFNAVTPGVGNAYTLTPGF